jgi:hypothetical protein
MAERPAPFLPVLLLLGHPTVVTADGVSDTSVSSTDTAEREDCAASAASAS